MVTATQLLNSGSIELGSMVLFPPNLPNLINSQNGTQYLRSGVVAKATDFPRVPSFLSRQLNPPVKVGDVGIGGSWKGLCLDHSGFPMICNSVADPATDGTSSGSTTKPFLYRIEGASESVETDVRVLFDGLTGSGLFSSNQPGSRVTKLAFSKGLNYVFVAHDVSKTDYGNVSYPHFSAYLAPGATSIVTGTQTGDVTAGTKIVRALAANDSVVVSIEWGTSAVRTGNGSTMTLGSMPVSANWSACCPGSGSNWVAVSFGSTSAASSINNGSTWTARSMPSAANWVDVCWNGTVYCAIAQGSTSAATSPDGITWTARTLPISQQWTSVAWSPALSLFLAVSRNSSVYATSPDGITWTQRAFPVAADWESVVWSPALSRFVVAASDGRSGVIMSDTGLAGSWKEKKMPKNLFFQTLISLGSTLYATREYASEPNGTSWNVNPLIAKSTDNGVTWTYLGANGFNVQIGSQTSNSWTTNIRAVNGRLMVISCDITNKMSTWTSTDGNTWTLTTQTLSRPYQFSDIAYGNGLYVVSAKAEFNSGSGYIQTTRYVTSPDGSTWTERSNLPITKAWIRIIFTGTKFAVLGGVNSLTNVVANSADGNNWTLTSYSGATGSSAENWLYKHSFFYHRNTLFAITWSTFLNNISTIGYSTDSGDTWKYTDSPFYPYAVPVGSRWAAMSNNTNAVGVVTADDVFNRVPYDTFLHGLGTFKGNFDNSTNYVPPTYHANSGQYLYLNANQNQVMTLDTNQWIDNRGGGNAFANLTGTVGGWYYMRVK